MTAGLDVPAVYALGQVDRHYLIFGLRELAPFDAGGEWMIAPCWAAWGSGGPNAF